MKTEDVMFDLFPSGFYLTLPLTFSLLLVSCSYLSLPATMDIYCDTGVLFPGLTECTAGGLQFSGQ